MLRNNRFLAIAFGFGLVLLFLLFVPGNVQAAETKIEGISIILSVDGDKPTPEVFSRIIQSMKAVSEKVFVGLDVSSVNTRKDFLELTLKEVFSRVLVGYQIISIKIEPDSMLRVKIAIKPTGDTIERVHLNLKVNNLSPELEAIIQSQKDGYEKEVAQIFAGLPVDAFTWTGKIIEPLVSRSLENEVPGFKVDLKLDMKTDMTVDIVLTPQEPVVKDIDVKVNSSTLPKAFLRMAEREIKNKANILIGVPTPFLEKYRPEIEQIVNEKINTNPLVKSLGIDSKSSFRPGTISSFELNVESNIYRVGLEGQVNIGADAPKPKIDFHLGRVFAKYNEIFFENRLILNPLENQVLVGYKREVSPKFDLYATRNLKLSETRIGMDYHLRDDLDFNVQSVTETSELQAGARYRIHDYLYGEIAGNSNGNYWFGLVGKL